MLDSNFILQIDGLIKPNEETKAIMLSRCSIYQSKDFPHSEMEDCGCCLINSNNGCGDINIEIEFSNADKYIYKNYFINTIAIRTDDAIFIKPFLPSSISGHAKVTKNGCLAINIKYFLEPKDDINKLLSSKRFIIEFSVSFDKKRNTYQVACVFVKTKKGWKLERGDTYRFNTGHIDSLQH